MRDLSFSYYIYSKILRWSKFWRPISSSFYLSASPNFPCPLRLKIEKIKFWKAYCFVESNTNSKVKRFFFYCNYLVFFFFVNLKGCFGFSQNFSFFFSTDGCNQTVVYFLFFILFLPFYFGFLIAILFSFWYQNDFMNFSKESTFIVFYWVVPGRQFISRCQLLGPQILCDTKYFDDKMSIQNLVVKFMHCFCWQKMSPKISYACLWLRRIVYFCPIIIPKDCHDRLNV